MNLSSSSLFVHRQNNSNEMLLSSIPKSRLLSFLLPKTLLFSKSPIPSSLIPMASSISTVSTDQDQQQQQQVVQRPLQIAKRLEKFKTTIFTQMSMLAVKHGAIDLGQGFPNFDGPDFVKEVTVTSGCTEAILLGLINPGDEVVVGNFQDRGNL